MIFKQKVDGTGKHRLCCLIFMLIAVNIHTMTIAKYDPIECFFVFMLTSLRIYFANRALSTM